jgi:hypothetical protein
MDTMMMKKMRLGIDNLEYWRNVWKLGRKNVWKLEEALAFRLDTLPINSEYSLGR